MSKRALEIGKTVLIILLAVLAVHLFTLARNYSYGGSKMLPLLDKPGQESAAVSEGTPLTAAWPAAAAVTGPDGRYTAIQDKDAVMAVYDICAPVLMEALGTAKETFLVDEALWLDMLGEQGVYLAYEGQVPISALAAWLGADFGYGGTVRRILMAPGPDQVVMLYLDDGKTIRGCVTSADYSTMDFSELRPNDGRFAFELGADNPAYQSIEPYSLVLDGMANFWPMLEASSPLSAVETRQAVLTLFGLNPYADSYAFRDGRALYTDADYQLQISDFYSVTIHCYDPQALSGQLVVRGEPGEITAIEAARALAAQTVGRFCGQAEVWLTDCSYDPSAQAYRVEFSYFIDGVRVNSPLGCAARITVSDGYISEAQLCLRRYTAGEETSYVLSPKYAAAALPGTQLIMEYHDGGGSSVAANWKA